MALCDECECYDDNWVDGEDITEEELENDPLYQPNRYYYWHGDIQRIIRCQKVMIAYAKNVLAIS